ncbi:MAG: hypothetical protein LJE91_05150, partial [Gammaproteobacteria bacterium]|nr:hypothetical protein [Gammaproteobacteria bacterium]
YQIAPDFRSSSRRDNRRIVKLCQCCRNTEDGRKDKLDGMSFDRNRLSRVAEQPFIPRERGSGPRMATQNYFDRHGLSLSVRMELGSNEAI